MMANIIERKAAGLIVLFVILAAAIGGVVIFRHVNHCVVDRSGQCLPNGQCIAPTDEIISCDKLNKDGSLKQ